MKDSTRHTPGPWIARGEWIIHESDKHKGIGFSVDPERDARASTQPSLPRPKWDSARASQTPNGGPGPDDCADWCAVRGAKALLSSLDQEKP